MAYTRREWLKTTGGTLGAVALQQSGPSNLGKDSEVSTSGLLTPKDMTLVGQVGAPDSTYANATLALRYVNDERRFITYRFDPSQADGIGDLCEYKLSASLMNGASHWTAANVPGWTEVRRWKNWSTRDRMLAAGKKYGNGGIFKSSGGNGVWAASFHWDAAQNLLWYTWQPQYPGGQLVWPAYSAVRLVDSEAGGTVSTQNIFGPYFFTSNTEPDDFKDASAGLIPIPTDRHAAMRGKFLNVGHHAANNGHRGPHGIGLWVTDGPPPPPPPESVLWPKAMHLYDTSSASGLEVPNMKAPNISYQAANHASQGTSFHKAIAGVVSPMQVGEPVGLSVGDCLYQHDYGGQDTLMVYMDAPASGGAWVPELYSGSAWVQPPHWKIAAGDAALGAAENVFYWPKSGHAPVAPPGLEHNWWVRLRRTVAGTDGGKVNAIITTTSTSDSDPYPYRPEGKGGHAPLGKEQYDAEHFSYMYEESMWGGAWVQTKNVEGLAYFGPLKVGGQWYGASPAWIQPKNGGVPVRFEHAATLPPQYGNGGKSEGPQYPFFFTFDHRQLMECAAGKRPRNTKGLNPTAFYRMNDEWPALIKALTAPNPKSPYFGQPSYNLYGTGHSVVFDPVTSEIVVMMTNSAVWNLLNVLAFWKVR